LLDHVVVSEAVVVVVVVVVVEKNRKTGDYDYDYDHDNDNDNDKNIIYRTVSGWTLIRNSEFYFNPVHTGKVEMAAELEKQVEQLLQEGDSRERIYDRLQGEKNRSALLFHLNNISLPAERRKNQILNLVLVTILVFVTSKKLIAAFAFGVLDIWLLLMLIVPIVNLYVLRQILRFRRLGYQFLFVLSLLALLQPENRHLQELLLFSTMIVLSGFLYLRLFPWSRMVRLPEGS
jgi:hypothetical protein